MRKIKVCQVITRMDWGGSPDILRVLCRGLDPVVFDVSLIIGKTGHASAKTRVFLDEFKGKVTVIKQLKRDISLFDDIMAFFKLYRVFRETGFDVVHTHTAKAGALARIAAYFAGVPAIIHTPHGHNFYGYFNAFFSVLVRIIEKLLGCFTDRIMVLTELEKSDHIKYRVANRGKLVLISQGLDLSGFDPDNKNNISVKESLGISGNFLVAGFVGRLEPVKGPQYFIKAAKKILEKREGVKFVLSGEGSLRRELEEAVASWGLSEQIVFLGWQENIPGIMSAMDMLVLPSLNEAVGIVLIEAQSLGIPVVASNVGGIPEVVKDGQTGLLVAQADPDALAQAMLKLLSDPALRRSMSGSALAWCRDRFKAEAMVDKVTRMYEEVLKEKNARA
ncbi:MAG: glycosyltransferase family 4 protein [Candidatus Omnitrophota bacterium]|jgi:glycosyltransferase involved in cell wall biosynthesis